MRARLKSVIWRVTVLVLVGTLLVGCGQGGQPTPSTSAPGAKSDQTAASKGGEVRGVTKTAIKIGMIPDLTGPYKGAGIEMREGAKAWFDTINEQGGIHGRKIELFVEDNQANPSTTMAAANKLIHNTGVLAIAGVHGAQAFEAIYDLVEKEKVPSISLGIATSNYKPFKKMVFGSAVPYAYEAGRMVDYIVDDLAIKNPKIGIVYQDDSFGADFIMGFEAEAKAKGIQFVAKESFQRGATDLSTQALKLKRAGADQVVMAAIFVQVSQFLKEAEKIGYKPIVVGPSPASSDLVFNLAGQASDGFATTRYFSTLPGDPGYEVVADVLQKKVGKKPSVYLLYGLVNAAILTEGLKAAGENPTPEKVVEGIEKLSGAPGLLFKPQYGPDKHFPSPETDVIKADFATKSWKKVAPLKGPAVSGF